MANVLEDFQIQKQKVVKLTQQAVDFGWLAKERGQEIIAKIERDVLTIGVIGQMKCGKSTFLNSFVFGNDVLPAATTPMTAALSVITYGQQEKVEAEFYTKDEWEEQKSQARRNLAELEGNEVEKSKVQEYYQSKVAESIRGVKQEDEEFYKKVKKLLDECGEVSDALGRLTDKDYFDTLSYEQKQRYSLDLSSKYVLAKQRYYKELEFEKSV